MEFDKRAGISDAQWRKWTLSMATVLLTQDGNILEAVMLWKQSLDKHFEGVEVCPICYSGMVVTIERDLLLLVIAASIEYDG
jgi:E3 ubiquitin-protein ligase listerin